MAKNFLAPIDLNNNEVRNFLLHLLATDPTARQKARIWFNTSDNRAKVDNGTAVKTLAFTDDIAPDSAKLGGVAADNYLTKTGANQTYIPKTAMGAYGGVATLGEDGKVRSEQLPDYLLGQLLWGGTVKGTTATVTQTFKDRYGVTSNTITLSTNNVAEYENVYFIASGDNAATSATPEMKTGDWIISNGTSWQKIDNTDSVSSVADLTGVITKEQLATALGLGNFVTSGDLSTLAGSLLGKDTDTKDSNSIKGAINYTEEVEEKVDSAIQDGSAGSDYIEVKKNLGTNGNTLTITPKLGIIDGINGLATTDQVKEYADTKCRKYTSTLAATANQTVTVTHNLNTETVIISLYTTQGEQVYADVQIASASTVKVTFGNITNQTLKIVIIG